MDVVKLAKSMIQINSENPPGNEKEICYFMKEYLKDNGFSANVSRIHGDRYNLTLRITGENDGLLLNGHLDTVSIGTGWKYKQGEITNGKLYGRGAADMKGGIASFLTALVNTKKINKTVVVTLVADEEVSFLGTETLVKNKKLFSGIEYGLIAEPTNLNLQIAQKGVVDTMYRFYGKSAHGSTPESGVNAVYKANECINRLLKYEKTLKVKDKLLGKSTMNVGKIMGGRASNVIPDYCEMKVDRRLLPQEKLSKVVADMKSISKGLGKAETVIAKSGMIIDQNSKIVSVLKKIAKPKLFGFTGYTEAEIYHRKFGIPVVVFGPGDIKQAHVPNEYVTIKDLKRAEKIFKKTFEVML